MGHSGRDAMPRPLAGHPGPANPPQAPVEVLIKQGGSDPNFKETPRIAKPAGRDF